MQKCWGLLEGARNKKYSKVSLELGGGQSLKNAEGVQGWSWKNSEMFSEQKTGCPLTDWDELLPLAEFQYNNHVHSATQQTPFMLDTGQHPQMGFEPRQPGFQLETINEFQDCKGNPH